MDAQRNDFLKLYIILYNYYITLYNFYSAFFTFSIFYIHHFLRSPYTTYTIQITQLFLMYHILSTLPSLFCYYPQIKNFMRPYSHLLLLLFFMFALLFQLEFRNDGDGDGKLRKSSNFFVFFSMICNCDDIYIYIYKHFNISP